MSVLIALALTSGSAFAGSCDAQLGKIATLTPEQVGPAYAELAACDKKLAESNFLKYLEKTSAEDSTPLVALMLSAVDNDTWSPAWTSLGKVASFEARDDVALQVGQACTDHPKVVKFLQGAYFGLRAVDFQQWDDALINCPSPEVASWLDARVGEPPASAFDEKYSALLTIYVKSRRAEALPGLAAAAVKAAGNSGPFDDLLAKMGEAVQPELGSQISAENQEKLAQAMVSVAEKVPVERARAVASTLSNNGAEAAAAGLLPKIYPDRVQAGGGFLYGVAVAEAGTCGGKKTVVLHYTTAADAGKRFAILGDLEGPMRAMKPALKDCELENPWPVIHTPEPIKSAGEADTWAEAQLKDWSSKGFDAKLKKEKAVTLP